VIDDSAETVAGLQNFLSNKYEVLTAANGLDGLKQIEEHESTIDLVITDLVMPDISGVGVISIVKKKYPAIPVIAITGWGDRKHWQPKPLLIWCWKSRLNFPNLVRVLPTCSPKRVIDLGLFYF
jgi:response regulator RpfG family c-di-GMP phosphodiesterase